MGPARQAKKSFLAAIPPTTRIAGNPVAVARQRSRCSQARGREKSRPRQESPTQPFRFWSIIQPIRSHELRVSHVRFQRILVKFSSEFADNSEGMPESQSGRV